MEALLQDLSKGPHLAKNRGTLVAVSRWAWVSRQHCHLQRGDAALIRSLPFRNRTGGDGGHNRTRGRDQNVISPRTT